MILADKHPDAKALLIEGMQEAGPGSDPVALTVTFSCGGTDAASRTHAELYQQMWQRWMNPSRFYECGIRA